jgi:multidrug efflux pump subunit AcrA (membrane-fusion protein)
MGLKRFLAPAATVTLLAVGAFAAYRTQAQWKPWLFPVAKGVEPKPADDPHAGHDHDKSGNRVALSPQAQANLGLVVDTVKPRDYWRTMTIPGLVVDRPGESDRGITTKVAGVVTEIKAKPGDTVKAGDALFTLQLASEFLQAAQTDLAKAARELEFATAKRDRTADLVKRGLQSAASLIEDENQVKRFATQVNATRRQLQLFGFTPDQVTKAESGDVTTELTVVVPQRSKPTPATTGSVADVDPVADLFEVQQLKCALGEQVTAGQVLATLANHRRLFVEGRAFKSEADALANAAKDGVPIRAEFADETPGAWPAAEPLRIHHLANEVDPVTRTFAVYLPLDNQTRTFAKDGQTRFVWRYRPGQRVRLKLPVERMVTLAADGKTALLPFVLPVGAVVREGAESYVFVQNGDEFVRKPVRVLHEDRTEIAIANDGSINGAEFVVHNRAAALNRALKGQADGGGHSHDHDH